MTIQSRFTIYDPRIIKKMKKRRFTTNILLKLSFYLRTCVHNRQKLLKSSRRSHIRYARALDNLCFDDIIDRDLRESLDDMVYGG